MRSHHLAGANDEEFMQRQLAAHRCLDTGPGGLRQYGEKTGAYVDYSWITTKVKSDMIADKDVSGHKIKVNTTKGVVSLTGSAASWREANKAAQNSHCVAGPVAVPKKNS